MKDDKLVDTMIIAVGVVILAPIVIGAVTNVVCYTYVGAANIINRVKFNRKIKKGLKDGSIIEIDGKYYEVEVEEA